jgi:hypothetical protein
VVAALALSATAAACGQTASETAASGGTDTAASTDDGAGAGGDTGDGAGQGAASADHQFPDLDVVTVADGATINLAGELAGGDTPVLLWFWAPH